MSLGSNIAEARKLRGLTQEKLAELVGVSFQAVSSWERDENLPDTARLKLLAEKLNISLDALFDEGRRVWTLKAPHSDPEHMYTYIKAKAQSEKLEQTLKALPLIREKHKGQVRKGMVDRAPYITHPLTLACHALAMGIVDDDVIAALLLHDVIEDTEVTDEDIEREFGKYVAVIVDGVTKLDKLNLAGENHFASPVGGDTRLDLQAENLRRMFLAMAKDIRVILTLLEKQNIGKSLITAMRLE